MSKINSFSSCHQRILDPQNYHIYENICTKTYKTNTHTHMHPCIHIHTHAEYTCTGILTILPFHFQVSQVRQFGYQELKAEHPVLYTRYAITMLVKNAPYQFIQVSATYADGYRATAVCVVVGPRAADKAMKTANSILARSVQQLQWMYWAVASLY